MGDRVDKLLAAGREKRVDECIQALQRAEAAAVSKKLSLLTYQINYRVKGGGTTFGKGNANQRRDDLVAILRSLREREHHAATSTWIVRLRIPEAETIIEILSKPLELETDYLRVAQIVPENSRHRGDAELQ